MENRNIKEKVWITHSKENSDKGVYPSVNHIYTRMAKGRQKLTDPAQQLKDDWSLDARMWAEDNGWQVTKNQKVVVELTAYFPADNKTRDVSNVFKLLMDAFTDIIYDDDEYALPRVIDFHRVEEGQEPYFTLDIYLKDEEDAIVMERLAQAV